MLGHAYGGVLDGIEGQVIYVEADIVKGLPVFAIVGLPDSAVTESKLRIRSAIKNSGFFFPDTRITINLSPASIRKRGATLDLAIAIAILRASSQIPEEIIPTAFCAELGLSGSLVPIQGALTLTMAFRAQHIATMLVSVHQPGKEWCPKEITWIHGTSLLDVACQLGASMKFNGPQNLQVTSKGNANSYRYTIDKPVQETVEENLADLKEVLGMEDVKRAFIIAACGSHHIFVVGPPGCGKTMLAERFGSILPNLTESAALDVYALYEAYPKGKSVYSRRPPVRIPHHSVTAAALIGGGNPPVPGEVTFANHGVLVLDELLEFARPVIDSLREPMTNHQVIIARAGRVSRLPAKFLLVATANPCPCGKHGFGECICSTIVIQRYWSKLSGPVMDRIDMIVSANRTSSRTKDELNSEHIRSTVQKVQAYLSAFGTALQSHQSRLRRANNAAKQLLSLAAEKLLLSQRATASILRIAETLSALENRTIIETEHIQEALSYRNSLKMDTIH